MKAIAALTGGIAGACALTLLHEIVRKSDPDAPRMDLLGMDALSKMMKTGDIELPDKTTLFTLTMAGDLLSNSLYYSLAGFGSHKQIWLRGILLGLGAGLGAVYLPEPLGLKEAPSNRTVRTKAMTVAWYLTGGVVASAVISSLKRR